MRVSEEDKLYTLSLIEEAQESGARRRACCDVLSLPERTLQRWEKDVRDHRRGPKTVPSNKLTNEEREQMIKISNSEKYMDMSPWQIVSHLADEGSYLASESSFYRVLREQDMLAHRRRSKPATHSKLVALTATAPNQVWSWDITFLRSPIKGNFYYLYMFMDIFSRKIVGFEVHECESMELSSRLVRRICLEEGVDSNQLHLHSDNGASMKGATMLATLQKLGVVPSFSRPSVSDDNPFSESLFRTLKYCPEFPNKPFDSLEEVRSWVEKFVHWYNNVHKHSEIKYVTPSERHEGKDRNILKKREEVYKKAREKNPSRWSGETRDWSYIEEVKLNHLKSENEVAIREVA
ncbi:IS3 family transposase [Bdellovibrionales bacterium]|nr:IS3 family transposase [Bdellovibrionales bacterium]